MTKLLLKVLISIIIYILTARDLLAVVLFLLNLLVQLTTELQATAVSVTLDKEITICSISIPPSFSLKTEHLDSLLKQLPSPYLLLGDFNGHNILWGNKENNSRGELIENFITNNDICLMNDYLSSYTQAIMYDHFLRWVFFRNFEKKKKKKKKKKLLAESSKWVPWTPLWSQLLPQIEPDYSNEE